MAIKHGNKHRPVAYCSIPLGSVAHACPRCLKAIAATAKLVEASADLSLGNDVYLYTPHTVQSLNSELTQLFSESRPTPREILLLSPPNLQLKCYNVPNPAVLQPLPGEGKPHDCEVISSHFVTPHPDLQTPLEPILI